MSENLHVTIAPAERGLGILVPGMGAGTSTSITGVEAIKSGLGVPMGSLTQLGVFSTPGFHSGRSVGPRSSPFPGSRPTCGDEGYSEMAVILFQRADDGAGPVSRARYLHPTNEVEKHAAMMQGEDLITHLGLEYYD